MRKHALWEGRWAMPFNLFLMLIFHVIKDSPGAAKKDDQKRMLIGFRKYKHRFFSTQASLFFELGIVAGEGEKKDDIFELETTTAKSGIIS